MTLINALLHANIGYGFRRKVWPKNVTLFLTENKEMKYTDKIEQRPVKLLGEDSTYDLNIDDIKAEDWETI